ncbi:MAG TPA: murein biosynthesis integral membrane protein MurJ [Micromonosporaceae bacterium]
MAGMPDAREPRPHDTDRTVRLPFDEPTVVLPTVAAMPGVAGAAAGSADTTAVLPAIGGPDEPTGGYASPGGAATAGEAVPAEAEVGSVARNSAVMAAGSLVSRVTGLLRTVAIGAALGATAVADDYNIANTLPNMVYELLLGGVLASVVVPLLVRARTHDADRGEAYAQRLLTLATVFLGAATVLAVLAAPWLTTLMASGRTPADERPLITVLGYLLLPEIFFYGLAALLGAVLNTRGHFAAPMWTPILNNIVVIVTAGLFMLLTRGANPTPGTITPAQVLVLGVGTTAGIVVQALGLWPALRRVGFRWRWRWDWRSLHLSELARVAFWMLCYVVVNQVAVLAVLKVAKYAGDRHAPGPTVYLYAFLIFMMVHGIVAVSIITALMPRMSAAAASHRYGDLADNLSLGTRLSAVILVPATAAYIVLGRPLAVTLFDWGNYGHDQALATGSVIAVSAIGLVPFAISQLQMFAFWAMPDTKTPALLNVPVVILRVGSYFLFNLVLPAALVVGGLMLGNALSYLVAVVLGYWLLRRRMGRLGLTRVAVSLARLTAAAVVAAVPALLVVLGLGHLLGTDKLGAIVQLVAGGLVLVAVYLAAAVALRAREVTEVWAMVRVRLGR